MSERRETTVVDLLAYEAGQRDGRAELLALAREWCNEVHSADEGTQCYQGDFRSGRELLAYLESKVEG